MMYSLNIVAVLKIMYYSYVEPINNDSRFEPLLMISLNQQNTNIVRFANK